MTIFHVARVVDWDAARVSGEYRVSTSIASLDEIGFIHASEAHQVDGVLERFYAGQSGLVVLAIDEGAVAADRVEIRREDSGSGELFPHLYGPIRPHWVTAIRPV